MINPKSTQDPIVKKKETSIDLQKKPRTINSHELLQGNEIFILHNGGQYHLRSTRSGKLILTK